LYPSVGRAKRLAKEIAGFTAIIVMSPVIWLMFTYMDVRHDLWVGILLVLAPIAGFGGMFVLADRIHDVDLRCGGNWHRRRNRCGRSPTRGQTRALTRAELPQAYVERDKAAESLLDDQNALLVYKFAGGLPKSWAEIDSEGHKQTLGPWVSTTHPGFIGDDSADLPVLESVEGYVALFGPASDERKYRMVCAITKVEYPQNSKEKMRVTPMPPWAISSANS
jgi:hypothetical protein